MTLLQVVGGARPYFVRQRRVVFCGAFAAFFLAACPTEEKKAQPAAPKPDFRAGLPQGTSLEGQLAAEAAARLNDADTIKLEQLLSALGDGGVSFGAARQVMGRNNVAIYCASADGAEGLILTVCEYPSAEAAQNGERETRVLTSKISGHQARVRKKSVLHLIRKSTTPDATVDAILAAFERS